ncbi:selenocysteine-specific translation elongation factor [Wolinella succinogenes]|uniref:selenocysteine-specific translation elongation factor n=1 Tax=Wolinella succinogenes TaxID=844 RepID=UPI002FCBD23E
MESYIVGTAGHIDHGKTALIRALNGFEGDTTPEEKKRGITVDLSFSNLLLREKNIAFIDVPGHEKLVKNMIAGAFGFDAMLLVVSAVEGIKPQTLEHLHIAHLLEIPTLIVALTKSDLVDPETLLKRESEILNTLKTLPNLHLHRLLSVSIYDPDSLERLKESLYELSKPATRDLGFFRYYIDRSFSIKGAGCVVSGTVLSGKVEQNQKIWCCELQKPLAIRGIEVHGSYTQSALPSQRAALNLTGVSHTELERGFLLTQKGYLRGFDRIDVEIFPLEPLSHQLQVQLFIGSKKVEAKILLLEENPTHPNALLATLKCDTPLFALFGERFILREAGRTLGGGKVLNPIAESMKKRQKLELLNALRQEDFAQAFRILLSAHKRGFGIISTLQRFAISQQEALEIAKSLPEAFVDEKELVLFPQESLQILQEEVKALLKKNKKALLSPASLGLKAPWASEALLSLSLARLEQEGVITLEGGLYLAPDSGIVSIEEYLEETLYKILEKQGVAPEAPYNLYDSLDIDRKSGDNALKRLTSAQKVIRLAHNLFITSESLRGVLELMRRIIKEEGYIEINNLKAHLPLSRKYLIAYLEYLDLFSDIRKEENKRVFR